MSANFDKPDDITGTALQDEELVKSFDRTSLSRSPIARNELPESSGNREVQNAVSSLSLKIGRLENRLGLIDASVATLSNEVIEIKQDLKTVLDILLTSPPKPSGNATGTPTTVATPPPPPSVSSATSSESRPSNVPKPGTNVVIDIGSNKPELVEIQLDDELEPVAAERFRKYLSEKLVSESRNGPAQTESQVEMLVWNSTYTYINNFNIGALNVPFNYGDSRIRYRPWSVAMWGKKAGDSGPYDVSQVLIAEESIFSLISEGKLSGEWIVFGQIVSGKDFCKSMIGKGSNKKGFIGFKQ